MSTSLKLVQTISAPAALVYRAFTNSTALREWLCDTATVEPKAGGRFYLAWNNGYYATGEYVKLTPEKEVIFIWHGRDDPAPSRATVHIEALDSGSTTLSLEHTGLDVTPQWEKAKDEISRGWNMGLENLVSVLEDGPDLRIVNRPMMGVLFGDYNAKKAEELGIPVKEGLRIEGTVEGLGAKKAGLIKNDVIVSFNGKPAPDFPALVTELQNKKAGDIVEVGIYRGAEKKRIAMELSRRPLPEIPATPRAFAEALKQHYLQGDTLLADVLKDVSDLEAAFKPTPDEWCAKEVLAHLIHGERDTHSYINDIVSSQERVADGYGDNFQARIAATVEVYRSVDNLVGELKRCEEETVFMIGHLPDNFVKNKASYWRLAFSLLQFPEHTKEHAEQIKVAIAAGRK